MADVLLTRLKRVRLAMHDITQAVSLTLDFPGTSEDTLRIRLQVENLTTEFAASVMFPDVASPYRRVQSEHASFITGFTQLVSVVVTQLKQLDATAESDIRVPRFWIIWELFTLACNGWMKWVDLENAATWGQLPTQPAAFSTAISSLMAWIISASRNNTYAWVELQTAQPEEDLVYKLYLILFIPCNSLFNTFASSPPSSADVTAWLRAHPRDYISLICCLMHEQLGEKPAPLTTATLTGTAHAQPGDRPGRVRHRDLTQQLATTVALAITVSGRVQSQALLDTLSTPAVIELLQLEIVLQGESQKSTLPSVDPNHLLALMKVVGNRANLARTGTGLPVPGSGGSLDLSPRTAVSQRRLLRVICGPSISLDQPYTLLYLRVLDVLLDSWSGQMTGKTLQSNESHCGSLATLVHHSSSRVLLWMQSFQTHAQRRRHASRMCLTPLQAKQQIELNGPTQVMFGKTVLVLLRSIMGPISDTCLQALAVKSSSVDHTNTAGHIQRLSNPKLDLLNTWCQMPGRIAVFEALMRDSCTPEAASIVAFADGFFIQLTPFQDMIHQPQTLLTCLSLAATVRKLLYTCMHPCKQQQHQQQQEQNAANEQSLLSLIPNFISGIVTALKSASMTVPALTSSNTGHVLQNASLSQTQSFQLQLKSLLLIIVVQMCQWLVQTVCPHTAEPLPDQIKLWLGAMKDQCQGLGDDVTELLNYLLSERLLSMPTPQEEVGKVLGRIALTHFHGRLLPGCCHLGCTNLSGPSEASLKTLLCSRCGRARYCSAACQRAAWLEGGHASLCRKGV